MHDDDSDELRASLALARLAWPQLVTLFSFLIALLLRYPTWFVVLALFVLTASIPRVAMDIARNPRRPFDFVLIDYFLVGSGWAASLLSMRWWHIERARQLEAGAFLTHAPRTMMIAFPTLAWCAVVMQWLSSVVVLIVTLIWAFSGRYRD